MGENTAISWADDTWNPWVGCQKTGSIACIGCYAEHLMDTRLGRAKWGEPHGGAGTRVRTSPDNWRKPLKWDREAFIAHRFDGSHRFVFCASLADVFDPVVPREWLRDLFNLIRKTPNLTWLLLTKRPQNIVKLFRETVGEDRANSAEFFDGSPSLLWPSNAAIGCTVVTQAEADRDIPHLLRAKAALNPAFAFLSMEPLVETVDLTRLNYRFNAAAFPSANPVKTLNALTGVATSHDPIFPVNGDDHLPPLDWIITGGCTDQGDHKAFPTHPDAFRMVRDQCAEAGVPYHHKQNGEWAACGESIGDWPVDVPKFARIRRDGTRAEDGWPMQKVGKRHAGRLLDDREHNDRPIPRAA